MQQSMFPDRHYIGCHKFGSRIPEITAQVEAIEKMDNEQENLSEYGNGINKLDDREYKGESEFDWENMITLTNSDEIFLGIAAGAFGILFGIYWLLTAAYAISKSNRVGINSYFFGLLTLGTNLFGVAIMWIWILIHPVCPECGKLQPLKANNCSHCGTTIYKKCPDCGERISIKDVYCHGCGKKCKTFSLMKSCMKSCMKNRRVKSPVFLCRKLLFLVSFGSLNFPNYSYLAAFSVIMIVVQFADGLIGIKISTVKAIVSIFTAVKTDGG